MSRREDGSEVEVIPFNRPSIEGRELEHIRAAVQCGHSSASGPYTSLVVDALREEIGAADVLLTTSCTSALEMAAMLLDLEPGDTVVVPSFGFVTTALAFARQGAQIVFCDIEPNTLGMDPDHLATLMDDSVRAVVPIHYAGVAGELDRIQEVLADWPRAQLVEDNAHGLFGRYRGRPLGSLGRFATLSFHETKNFTCGEGGALVLNDRSDVERAHVVLNKGTNRRAFVKGQVDKYTWVDTGSSFGLSDILAAYLHGQLEQRESILRRRHEAFEHYRTLLEPAAVELGCRLPNVPPDREQAYHMFYVLLPSAGARDHVLAAMLESGVMATFHYVPLHRSDGAKRFGRSGPPADCPVTDDVSARLLRFPFFTTLSDRDAARAVDAFLSALAAHVA
jgi:dTDP-4-amino-4,6-dideoxygalactose transaminase